MASTKTVLSFAVHYRSYVLRYPLLLSSCTLLAIVAPVIALGLLWAVKDLIDNVFVGQNLDVLPRIAVIYIGLALAKIALGYISTLLDVQLVESVVQDIRVDAYRHLASLPPDPSSPQIGAILSHLERDVPQVEYIVYTGVLSLLTNSFGALFFACSLLWMSWHLTAAALIVAPVLIFSSGRMSPWVRRVSRISRFRSTRWMTLAEERLSSLPLIHAFGTAEAETTRFSQSCIASRKAEVCAVKIQAKSDLIVEFVGMVGGLGVLAVGAFDVHSGAMTVGMFIAFLGSLGSLYGPIRNLAKAPARFQRAAASVQRISELLNSKPSVEEAVIADQLEDVKGQIVFSKVHFGYTARPVLHDVSFAIEAGETVAIVGATGAGKSTIVKLMLRQVDPTGGAVTLDGIDIRSLSNRTLRNAISVVLQEPYLVSGSIEDNIRYGHEHLDPQALRMYAHAAAAESIFVGNHLGLSAQVGPHGNRLSGGQKQRVALARALACEAPILILDEATGAVDSETEEFIYGAVSKLGSKKTVIIIAHRLSSILAADRVIVLDGGAIVETGPPHLLLGKSGRCREIFEAQLIQSAA